MTESRWQRIESLFLDTVDLPSATRDAYLRAACGADRDLRAEVDALLTAEVAADAAIGTAVADAAEDFADFVVRSHVGERVGSYRLVDVIGQGGMGTVYLAERADDAYRARVAIKFVRGALAAPELTRRFLAERQILADLNHPGIARLLDGGATVDGTPYLVLEFIDGVPIDAWCDARSLGLRERIELLLKVCDAVHYAHGAGVVHRDLKPSNILVAADGTPKLVDFGIAKLLTETSEQQTGAGLQILTPAFASPEQVLGQPATVTSDVYSLGAVMYRLLTGTLPFNLSGASAGEVERRVVRQVPPELSATARENQLGWHRDLEGDFDAIAKRALEKRADLRYPSVDALAADLRAALATPARTRRWQAAVRRFTRHGIAAAALVLIAVSSVTVATRAALDRRDAAIAFRFLPVQMIEAGIAAPQRVVKADINGDGRSDLVWNHLDDSTNVFAVGLAQPDGRFVMRPPVNHPGGPPEGWRRSVRLLVSDIDGDGRDELLWLRLGEGLFNLAFVGYFNPDGTIRFAEPFHFGHSTLRWGDWNALVADFDADGKDDLVFNILREDNNIRAFRSMGDGMFTEQTPVLHFAKRWAGYRAFVGDVDGDGRDDLLWNDVPVWENRTYVARSWGDRYDLLSQQDHPVTSGWSDFQTSVADFDGDDRTDIVWTKSTADTLSMFIALGQSSALFRYLPVQQFAVRYGARPMTPVVGDFNSDGRADLLWPIAGTDSLLVMRATGSGRFSPLRLGGFADVAGDSSAELLPMDVNGDGRDDLIRLDTSSGRLYVAVAAPRS